MVIRAETDTDPAPSNAITLDEITLPKSAMIRKLRSGINGIIQIYDIIFQYFWTRS